MDGDGRRILCRYLSPEGPSPVVARPRRASPILVCKKCLKRAPEGADIKRELKRQDHGKIKRPRLVSTSCFGICPKRAVVLAGGHSLQSGEFIAVSRPREVEEALKCHTAEQA